MKKYIFLFLMMGVLSIVTHSLAEAANLDWQGDRCVTIDGTFTICKPNSKWDTQKNPPDAVVRWERHMEGVNPQIRLKYDQNVSGKTAHDYAKRVTSDLQSKGVRVSRVQNTVINGRNVSLLTANKDDGTEYLIAVYRDQQKGLRLVCSAPQDKFGSWAPEFRTAINSVRFSSH